VISCHYTDIRLALRLAGAVCALQQAAGRIASIFGKAIVAFLLSSGSARWLTGDSPVFSWLHCSCRIGTRRSKMEQDAEIDHCGRFARRSFAIIAGLQLRVHRLVTLAAGGSGGLGSRPGLPWTGPACRGSELEIGDHAEVDFMESAAGWSWRALLLWLLLFGLANLVGG
jgi:hypothetical protein